MASSSLAMQMKFVRANGTQFRQRRDEERAPSLGGSGAIRNPPGSACDGSWSADKQVPLVARQKTASEVVQYCPRIVWTRANGVPRVIGEGATQSV